MKLAQIFIFMFVAYLTIGLLNQTLAPNLTSDTVGTGNAIFDILLQPWNWSSASFWTILASISIIAVGVLAAGLVLTRSDISVLAPIAAGFLAAGTYIMSTIYSFILNGVIGFIPACRFNTGCLEANLIASLIVGVMGLMYFFSVLEWWAWRPTSTH